MSHRQPGRRAGRQRHTAGEPEQPRPGDGARVQVKLLQGHHGHRQQLSHGPQQATTERRKTAQSCSSPESAAAGNAAVPPRQRQKYLPAHPIWATGRQGIANATDGKLPPASAEWAGSAILKISKVTRHFLLILYKTKSKSKR